MTMTARAWFLMIVLVSAWAYAVAYYIDWSLVGPAP